MTEYAIQVRGLTEYTPLSLTHLIYFQSLAHVIIHVP